MQISTSPYRARLQREVQQCEDSLKSLEEVASYSRDRDWFEPALKGATLKRNIGALAMAGAVAGIVVGLTVPAAAIALPAGLVVALYAGMALSAAKKEIRSIQDAKSQNTTLIAMFDTNIQQARARLAQAKRELADAGDEPSVAVQKLVDGLKQSTQIVEDSARVTFAGVSLKKRR